jgi:tetratricopeptide (TPR) repeat protein
VPVETLAARGAEALAAERFKDAIEMFKLAIRQDVLPQPRPQWRAALNLAYGGRARVLAAKGMVKEAAMVLENTLAADGAIHDPALYVQCLIRDGQQPKAAVHLLGGLARPAGLTAALEELTAALLMALPQLPDFTRIQGDLTRWRGMAVAARAAIAAWSDGAPAETVDAHLAIISLRSAFRPVRVLLKSQMIASEDAPRARQLLETVPSTSPFFPWRQAVAAALLPERARDEAAWNRLTPAQQKFVIETGGLSEAATQSLLRMAEAARNGPDSLFACLLKQTDLPAADRRSACLNLLAQVPDRMALFEKSFGPLTRRERSRIQALAAEARGDWAAAERAWQTVIDSFDSTAPKGEDPRQARLSQATILRHLAHCATKHPDIYGGYGFEDAEAFYLDAAGKADPEYVPDVLELIAYYRHKAMDKPWHQLADDAVARFPADSQVLQQAIDSAMARKAYKKAAGFARRLLELNPINPAVRRQMIESQVAHARKQMRAGRPDLAGRELAAAAEWERADAPSAPLRLARALVAAETQGADATTEAALRDAVALAGGGVAGWLRAQIEAMLLKSTAMNRLLQAEQMRACAAPPTREAIMAVAAALAQPEVAAPKQATAPLLQGVWSWLRSGAGMAFTQAEFQVLAELFVRWEGFDLLGDYARAGKLREPDNPEWRFHEIVARTRGSQWMPTIAETNELMDIADAAARRGDIHAAQRIERFLRGKGPVTAGPRRTVAAMPDEPDDLDDLDDLDRDAIRAMVETMTQSMPKQTIRRLRQITAGLDREAAGAAVYEMFGNDPDAPPLPDEILRMFCEAMVARLRDGAAPRTGRRDARPELPFR